MKKALIKTELIISPNVIKFLKRMELLTKKMSKDIIVK